MRNFPIRQISQHAAGNGRSQARTFASTTRKSALTTPTTAASAEATRKPAAATAAKNTQTTPLVAAPSSCGSHSGLVLESILKTRDQLRQASTTSTVARGAAAARTSHSVGTDDRVHTAHQPSSSSSAPPPQRAQPTHPRADGETSGENQSDYLWREALAGAARGNAAQSLKGVPLPHSLAASAETVPAESVRQGADAEAELTKSSDPPEKPTSPKRNRKYVSIFDLFSIGVGPSSSHTVGPMRASHRFLQNCEELLPLVKRCKIELFGSLALTGKGHKSDYAVLLGAAGFEPHNLDLEEANAAFDAILATKQLTLFGAMPEKVVSEQAVEKTLEKGLLDAAPDDAHPLSGEDKLLLRRASGVEVPRGRRAIPFDPERDLVFHMDQSLPQHPNGARFTLYFDRDELLAHYGGERELAVVDHEGDVRQLFEARTGAEAEFSDDSIVTHARDYFSIGGGFILDEAEMSKSSSSGAERKEGEADFGTKFSASEGANAAAGGASAQTAEAEAEHAAAAQQQADEDEPSPARLMEDAPFPFATFDELKALCETHQMSIAELMMANECSKLAKKKLSQAGGFMELGFGKEKEELVDAFFAIAEEGARSRQQVEKGILEIVDVMELSIINGLTSGETVIPGGLKVKRRASKLQDELIQRNTPMSDYNWLNVFAIAVNEENAAGGRVVTAPTNGAAGVIPAVLKFYLLNHHPVSLPGMGGVGLGSAAGESPTKGGGQGGRMKLRKAIIDYMLTSNAIGAIYKKGASISAAEVGCQGEVGVACSMSAGALCAVLGGSLAQIEQAAEMGMEHNLGLTCDPIGGLVQIPCIERNAMGALQAWNAAKLSLLGDGEHLISLDTVVRTMRETGKDMSAKYKETSLGGLAIGFKGGEPAHGLHRAFPVC